MNRISALMKETPKGNRLGKGKIDERDQLYGDGQ